MYEKEKFRGCIFAFKSETVASKNTETVSAKAERDLKLDNLESGKEKLKKTVQNGSPADAPSGLVKNNEGKPKPPVPPKRSTLTFGRSYISVADGNPNEQNAVFSPTGPSPQSKESQDEPCQPLTSHLVTVTTNILSTTPKGLPTPRLKNQKVLSTFLPVLPPKFCKSPLIQSPNFCRPQSDDFKKFADLEQDSVLSKSERRVSEKDSTSPSSVSSTKTQSSSTSNSLDKDLPKDDSESVKSSAENTPNKAELQKDFSPSQSPPPLVEFPVKPPRKSPPQEPFVRKPLLESSPPSLESSPLLIRHSPSLNVIYDPSKEKSNGAETKVSERLINTKDSSSKQIKNENKDIETIPPETLYLDDSNEKTNTIKRAPSSDKDRLSATAVKLRPKSPIRVSFANENEKEIKIYEKLSRTKRATKELKNIIHQIEYSENDYCSDDNCRTCVVRKTSSLSRRRSASPKTTFCRSIDLLEGYTSCCEEGTKTLSKKTKSLTRKIGNKKGEVVYNRVLCNCPLDNLVLDNRIPISRPNSSIGDYCSQSGKSKSAVRAKKNSGAGIKTPFWGGSSKFEYSDKPGLGLIVTISSDGIDKEPKRTVQFISGGPTINFGLGGTLGRYTKSKSQDKTLKISGSSFHADHSSSDFEDVADWVKNPGKLKSDREDVKNIQIKEETTQEILNGQKRNEVKGKPILGLERQKSAGDLRRLRTSQAAEEYRQRYVEELNRKKSPGEVLEHFGRLATSVTTSEISKISKEKKEENDPEIGKGHSKTFRNISKSGNQSHSFENYRTVPPTSFNNPELYLGSAFVQYVRETLPHQPNSFPGSASGSAFNKYIRPGSGRFDKSLIFPQQPKSDKPSAFERLCGNKIYSSRRGIYGKVPPQNQNVSGSLDCVWGKPNVNEPLKTNIESEDESAVGVEIRPASCTYEINRERPASRVPGIGSYANYSTLSYSKEKTVCGIPRTSKKGIIESETSINPATPEAQSTKKLPSQGAKAKTPQYFNPRSLENYKLAPGFKTDLSTLYSGVFYTNPKQDCAPSKIKENSTRLLNEYGIMYSGTLSKNKEEASNEVTAVAMEISGRGSSSAESGSGRKPLIGAVASIAAASRIPEEAAPGVTVSYPPQYHPTEQELLQENQQVNAQVFDKKNKKRKFLF